MILSYNWVHQAPLTKNLWALLANVIITGRMPLPRRSINSVKGQSTEGLGLCLSFSATDMNNELLRVMTCVIVNYTNRKYSPGRGCACGRTALHCTALVYFYVPSLHIHYKTNNNILIVTHGLAVIGAIEIL